MCPFQASDIANKQDLDKAQRFRFLDELKLPLELLQEAPAGSYLATPLCRPAPALWASQKRRIGVLSWCIPFDLLENGSSMFALPPEHGEPLLLPPRRPLYRPEVAFLGPAQAGRLGDANTGR